MLFKVHMPNLERLHVYTSDMPKSTRHEAIHNKCLLKIAFDSSPEVIESTHLQ